jgi:hypothetical protein
MLRANTRLRDELHIPESQLTFEIMRSEKIIVVFICLLLLSVDLDASAPRVPAALVVDALRVREIPTPGSRWRFTSTIFCHVFHHDPPFLPALTMCLLDAPKLTLTNVWSIYPGDSSEICLHEIAEMRLLKAFAIAGVERNTTCPRRDGFFELA